MFKCGFNYICITIYGRCKSRNELIFSFCVSVYFGHGWVEALFVEQSYQIWNYRDSIRRFISKMIYKYGPKKNGFSLDTI